MKTNIAMMLGIAFIVSVVVNVLGDLGEIGDEYVVTWYFPVLMLILTGIPFVLGYLAVKTENEEAPRTESD